MAMHWVLVGDAAGAKVYESDALLEELKLVDEIGVGHDLPGAGRHANEAHHDPHVINEEKFARAVAKVVNDADGKHSFERLIVVAPPRFLGDFRAALSHNAGRRVVASIHHDWTKLGLRDLASQVRKNLPDSAGMPG
jgi:protein required for attachment to host cells